MINFASPKYSNYDKKKYNNTGFSWLNCECRL